MGQDINSESDTVLSESENSDVIRKANVACAQVVKDEKKYICTFLGCDKAFVRPSRLARHIRFHTGERSYKCNYPRCEKAYTNSSHLKRHMETHDAVKKTYECPECQLSISNRHNLKRHYNLMHGDHSKLTCKECNETFTKKYQLATHMSMHTGELHKCDQCNKSFTNFRRYKRHRATHDEGTKTYSCTVAGCTENFKKWQLLCAHLKTQHVIHYKCKNCDKVFLKKNHLKAHSKVHMENRPVIPCPYDKCPRVYYYKSNLDMHIRTSHLGQKFQCDICKIEISSKAKLADHIHKLHMSERRIKRIKKGQRKKRKDAGTRKRSAISALIGLNLPPKVEKMVLERQENISYIDQFETVPGDNPDL
ncbi:PREDICTED: zinc finger protein 568-like [Dufourea novaeangliae]|uniref:zinc finger protein 568-like n=1 Tax=Dufourea novaeangliae TaxID=178035 RepID=UPI000767B460|nr:PREDICTED: zinc finger protein 568-like [Dufourea novaeangliae]XP_015431190.1 PREDICTED: zinc finger protein 568-like [Dufourea novaeangliae]